jgi:hypothetical protein
MEWEGFPFIFRGFAPPVCPAISSWFPNRSQFPMRVYPIKESIDFVLEWTESV